MKLTNGWYMRPSSDWTHPIIVDKDNQQVANDDILYRLQLLEKQLLHFGHTPGVMPQPREVPNDGDQCDAASGC